MGLVRLRGQLLHSGADPVLIQIQLVCRALFLFYVLFYCNKL